MINNLRLLRNLGTFDNVSTGAHLPFGRLTTIYAENAKGKTTLAAVFRSVATGDRIPIVERQRFAAQHPPQVRITCAAGGDAVFDNGAWSRTLPEVAVFDDIFVDENIHSGLAVDPEHRQKLHELVLGAAGVALNKRYLELGDENEGLNTEKRAREGEIPTSIRGPYTVDQFVGLQPTANIDRLIEEATKSLAASRELEPIRQRATFGALSLPGFDVAIIERFLAQDLPALDANAAAQVQDHLARLGAGGENWVAEGMRRVPVQAADQPCPFCAKPLSDSPVINHYRAYFSESYTGLKRHVAELQESVLGMHSGDAQGAFERAVRVAGDTRAFWARYCDVPSIALDTETIARVWREARERVLAALQLKQAAPLEASKLSDAAQAAIMAYNQHCATVAVLNSELQAANARINNVKANAAAGNVAQLTAELARLQSQKARQEPANVALCMAYQRAVDAKTKNEKERAVAKDALEQYRAAVFPAVQVAVNRYLQSFGAGFSLANVEGINARGGSACNYSVVIDDTPVAIAGGQPNPGQPTFKNTLSAGDRNTLALAFFLAALDLDPGLAQKFVVIDDPFSSLDDHRATVTIQELRRLAGRVTQVIVLSHNKRFVASLWAGTDRNIRAALQVIRDAAGSTLAAWDVNADEYNEHDRRHERLRTYTGAPGDAHAVAQDIRPTLEAFLRVAYPEQYPPGTLIGPFIVLCDQRQTVGNPLLSATDTHELRELNEYGSRFHHDTNAAYNAGMYINDGELAVFVTRTLRFIRRP